MFHTLFPSSLQYFFNHKKASRTMRMKSTKRASVRPKSETKPASVLAKPSANGPPTSEEAIRLCAYRNWETAGKPGGNGVNFWLEAEQEVSQHADSALNRSQDADRHSKTAHVHSQK